MREDILSPLLREFCIHSAYRDATRASAPQATTVRIDVKLSPAIDEAFSFDCSTSRKNLMNIGTVTPYTNITKRMAELDTRVNAQEYRNATT